MSKAGEHTCSELKTLDAMNLTLSRILMSFFMLKVSCFSKRIGKWGGTQIANWQGNFRLPRERQPGT